MQFEQTAFEQTAFDQLSRAADEAGLRLEMVRGLATVEASPVFKHQKRIFEIQQTIRPMFQGDSAACACVHAADVQIRFPDGSRKRPDIAVFCREPDEQATETTLLPEVVIEVISRNYEAKDLVIGVPFYQQVGISDIVVLDPETNTVRHWQTGQPEKTYPAPITLSFRCGCAATI